MYVLIDQHTAYSTYHAPGFALSSSNAKPSSNNHLYNTDNTTLRVTFEGVHTEATRYIYHCVLS